MTLTSSHQQNTPFPGFLDSQSGDVAVPYPFFSDLLPEITDPGELKVTLYVFRMLAEHGGNEAPIAERSIIENRTVRDAFRLEGISSLRVKEAIVESLDRAVARGTLLRVESRGTRQAAAWYFLHTRVTRELVDAISRGAMSPPRVMWTDENSPEIIRDQPTAFYLYEQNIGPLTPLVADRIARAMDEFPLGWIEDAIDEAVAYNRRSWKYIERILESWSQQGRNDRSS